MSGVVINIKQIASISNLWYLNEKVRLSFFLINGLSRYV